MHQHHRSSSCSCSSATILNLRSAILLVTLALLARRSSNVVGADALSTVSSAHGRLRLRHRRSGLCTFDGGVGDGRLFSLIASKSHHHENVDGVKPWWTRIRRGGTHHLLRRRRCRLLLLVLPRTHRPTPDHLIVVCGHRMPPLLPQPKQQQRCH